jgi:hypothetical protein
MKKTAKANASSVALQSTAGKPQQKVTPSTMPDLKALQDKARLLLRPQQYGGYAGL